MKVEIKLYAYLRKYAPGDKNVFVLDVTPGTTVGHVVERLSIPPEEGRLTLVNGRHVKDEIQLKDDDTLVFLTPMEGG